MHCIGNISFTDIHSQQSEGLDKQEVIIFALHLNLCYFTTYRFTDIYETHITKCKKSLWLHNATTFTLVHIQHSPIQYILTTILTVCDCMPGCQRNKSLALHHRLDEVHAYQLALRAKDTPKHCNVNYDTHPYHYKCTTVFPNKDDKPCKKKPELHVMHLSLIHKLPGTDLEKHKLERVKVTFAQKCRHGKLASHLQYSVTTHFDTTFGLSFLL